MGDSGMGDVLDLMWRDAAEAPWLLAFVVLPVVVAGLALRGGSRIALIPVVIFIAEVALWFAYYATDWFSNPGAGLGALLIIIPALIGLVIAVAALLRKVVPRRARGR
jgi:hypothetical protein